jgi:hypothetical protein
MRWNPLPLCIVAVSFCAAGCSEAVYPPPVQRTRPAYRLRQFLEMGSGADFPWASIVGGVMPTAPGLDWSWTSERPSFLFRLDQTDGWDLEIKLTSPEVVIAKTGPQHVTVSINGVVTGTAILDRSRSWELRFPVRPELLERPAATRVSLSIEPCLPQPKGPPFCTLLHRIGFSRDLGSEDAR